MAIFDIGPFRLYRVEKNNTLCVSLICMDDWACGWEYGWCDPERGEDSPVIEFRIGKLMVFYLSINKCGCEIWVLGFWSMPSWGKGRK
jgi:hypothetical protein